MRRGLTSWESFQSKQNAHKSKSYVLPIKLIEVTQAKNRASFFGNDCCLWRCKFCCVCWRVVIHCKSNQQQTQATHQRSTIRNAPHVGTLWQTCFLSPAYSFGTLSSFDCQNGAVCFGQFYSLQREFLKCVCVTSIKSDCIFYVWNLTWLFFLVFVLRRDVLELQRRKPRERVDKRLYTPEAGWRHGFRGGWERTMCDRTTNWGLDWSWFDYTTAERSKMMSCCCFVWVFEWHLLIFDFWK